MKNDWLKYKCSFCDYKGTTFPWVWRHYYKNFITVRMCSECNRGLTSVERGRIISDKIKEVTDGLV